MSQFFRFHRGKLANNAQLDFFNFCHTYKISKKIFCSVNETSKLLEVISEKNVFTKVNKELITAVFEERIKGKRKNFKRI